VEGFGAQVAGAGAAADFGAVACLSEPKRMSPALPWLLRRSIISLGSLVATPVHITVKRNVSFNRLRVTNEGAAPQDEREVRQGQTVSARFLLHLVVNLLNDLY
jgi:hypothetical protein